MDGSWRPKGEDAEYTLPDLLKNSRRMPEIVIVLKCKEEVSISRHMADIEDDLKAKFEKAIEDREAARVKRRQEAKDEKLKELDESPPAVEDVEEPTPEQIAAAKEAAMAEWEQARDEQEQEEDENDDEKPDLEKMKEEKTEEIKTICESDETNLTSLKEKLTEEWKAVEVQTLDTSKYSAEFIHIKLLNMLEDHIKYRQNLVERAQVMIVDKKEV